MYRQLPIEASRATWDLGDGRTACNCGCDVRCRCRRVVGVAPLEALGLALQHAIALDLGTEMHDRGVA